MGNCLKTVSSHDDISLLRDSAPTAQRDSSDHSSLVANIINTAAIQQQQQQQQHQAQTHFALDLDGSRVSTTRNNIVNAIMIGGTQQQQQQENNTGSTLLFYPSPNVSRQANQLTEEEQIKIAQRIGLIQHLPTGSYDGCKKNRECVICMIEFLMDDPIRFLPCMHIYHTKCIDDWLMRSLTCPSCMEPVDAALLSAYQTD
ncbi:RING finger protein 11 [Dermatophagoides farinae]|uniref:RING finger protein 11 n=1 Tax=Dermatophagoides farinae TaxID=6954 RepID=A0A922L5N5_DERFA|nr:RING finger protein 11 [Dermatophagoides farinae]